MFWYDKDQERVMQHKKREVIRELEETKNRILKELSGVDKVTLTRLREVLADYNRIDHAINEKIKNFMSNGNVILDGAEEVAKLFQEEINKINYLEDYVQNTSFVTPQAYGAKGDGVTDDSEAFQRALDSGNDVYIPLSKNEIYYIGNTLNVTTRGQKIFSTGLGVLPDGIADRGHILFDENLDVGFNVSAMGVHIEGLALFRTCANDDLHIHKVTAIKRSERTAGDQDGDMTVMNCYFYALKEAVYHYGRGLWFENNCVTACDYGVIVNFVYETGEALRHEIYGSRALRIANNRFHSTAIGDVTLHGSSIFGFNILGNTKDTGRGYFVRSHAPVYHSIISNNIIHYCSSCALDFLATVEGLIVSGNECYSNPDVDERFEQGGFIGFTTENGSIKFITIGNNIIERTKRSAIMIHPQPLTHSSISGNIFKNIGTDETDGTGLRACVQGSLSFVTVMNNVVKNNTGVALLGGFSGRTYDHVQALGNVCNTSIIDETWNFTDNGNNNIQES